MKFIVKFIFGILLSASSYGQRPSYFCKQISTKDSILFQDFSLKLKNAINTRNKVQLSTLYKFPFAYFPGDSNKNEISIPHKVTKRTFKKYNLETFFDSSLANLLNKDKKTLFFSPLFDDKCNFTEVAMSYNSESSLKIFFLSKLKGEYKITAIQIHP